MGVALITPHYRPSVRGNSITVQRIESGLRDRGVEVQVLALDRQQPPDILAALGRRSPTVVHGFHATQSGPLVAEATRRFGIPSAITVTGTDVNQDLLDGATRPLVQKALQAVGAIVVFHASIGDRIRREAPVVAGKIRVIAQAAACGGSRYDLRRALGLDEGDFVFFHPVGLRRVKNIRAVIPPLVTLHTRHPNLRYVLAGPVIEPDEAARVTGMLRGLPWAAYLGALDHGDVCAALSGVQAVINSSLSEGGMSNAVLEAMSRGVPVLASDIEGNRSVVMDGEDGLLFASTDEFLAKAERLLTDPALCGRLGRQARMKMASQFRLDVEIAGHLALYRDLAAGRGD